MEETNPPSAPASSSAVGRMFNVLAAPSEVFHEIKEQPVAHSNWVVPALISCVIGIVAVLLLFSQDWAMAEIARVQEKAMDVQVEQKKITREQADQGIEMVKKYMPIMVKVGGIIATVMYSFGVPFFWGFLIWLVGVKFLKGDFEYMKAVEAAGLGSIIYALTGLLGALVSLALGKLTYLSGAIVLSEVDFTNKTHMALAAINPFYLWFVCVMASATAIFAGASWGKAVVWLLGIWILLRAVLIAINMGQFVM